MSGPNPWVNPPSGRNAQNFDSPTFTGIQIGETYPASVGGIPLIGLSSGSVSAAGAISGITALPLAYPAAYCYFPANILATSIAAGWYYCTFTTTTAGTAFLNTYTSGTPTIPVSPTAVTDGKGAFTGDLNPEVAHTFNIAANTLGKWGGIRIAVAAQIPNNADTKTLTVKIGTTAFGACSLAGVAVGGLAGEIVNTGDTGKQISFFEPFWVNPNTINALGTIDTTAQISLTTTIQRGTATDNIVLLPPTVEIIRAQ